MGYSNNEKFQPLTNSTSLYSDGCGETYEQKYYFNGTYIDLCGLPLEEYMKNPYCECGPNSGTGDDDNSKTKNIIKVSSYEENGFVYYKAITDYPVSSDIKISVYNNTTEAVTILEIYIGEMESTPEVGDDLNISKVELNITEDDNFQYVTSISENTDEPEIIMNYVYTKAIPLINVKDVTSDSLNDFDKFEVNNGASLNLVYTIPASDVDTGDMGEEELNKYCEENQYAFLLVLPKNFYNEKTYTLYNYGGIDVTNKFTFNSFITIDSTEYVCLIEKATDDISPYVPIYEEDLTYEYKLTVKKQ